MHNNANHTGSPLARLPGVGGRINCVKIYVRYSVTKFQGRRAEELSVIRRMSHSRLPISSLVAHPVQSGG